MNEDTHERRGHPRRPDGGTSADQPGPVGHGVDSDRVVADPPEGRIAAVRQHLGRLSAILRPSTLHVESYDPRQHRPIVGFDGVPGTEEVERYWVNPPFAFVVILYDHDKNEHRYRVIEPELTEEEYALLERVFADIRDPLINRSSLEETDPQQLLRDTLREQLGQYGVRLDTPAFSKLLYYLHRAFRGYGKIDPLMHDPHIEDVSCDGYDLPIFVYHDGYTDLQTNITFEREDLDNFVVRLAQQSGRHVSVGDPMVEATLAGGSRVQLAFGEEVTPRGSAFTIRKYADEPFTPVDLVDYGTFSVEQMAYLWLAIEHNKSLIFAGGTASGKTTSMNAVSMFIPPRSKVISIEDIPELTLYHDNWLSNVTRERLHESTDIDMYDLLRAALRHRPEYIIVGEVRGAEAITLFQAMNTGHTTYSTIHADSVQTVINRLENEPINVPRPMVASLDILCVQTLTRFGDERVRRNQTIAEIQGIDQRTGELDYSPAYQWDPQTDTVESMGSAVLDEIADDRGWDFDALRTELERRERVLEYLLEQEVTDYRRFTAIVNEYYADKAAVLERIGADIPAAADGA